MGCSLLPAHNNSKMQTFTLKSELQFITSLYPGKIFARAQENSTPILYFLRDFQINIQNKVSLQQTLQQFDKGIVAKDIDFCRIVQIDSMENSMGLCGTTTRLTVLYQHYSVALSDEILARKGMNNKFFLLEDLWSLLQGLLTSIEYLQNMPFQTKNHMEKLRILPLLHAHPSRILVTSQGQIKIMNPFEYSFQQRFVRCNKSYYSPQKILDFTFIEDVKSTLFQLGLTMLSAALLQDCSDIYDGYQIDAQLLINKSQKVWQIYGDYWFSTLLNNLLQIKRCKRLETNQLLKLARQGIHQFQQNQKKSKTNSGILPTYIEQKQCNDNVQDFSLIPWIKQAKKQSMPVLNAQITNSVYPSINNSTRNSLGQIHQIPNLILNEHRDIIQNSTKYCDISKRKSPSFLKSNEQNTMQTSGSNPRSFNFFATASFSKNQFQKSSNYKKNQIKCNYQIGNFSEHESKINEQVNLKKQRSELSFKNLQIFTKINIDIYDSDNIRASFQKSQKDLKKSTRNSAALQPKILKII